MHVCRMRASMHTNEDTDVITRRWLMQCGATCCSALQCVAVRCSAVQCGALRLRCSALQRVAVRCSALQCCSSGDDEAPKGGMISRTMGWLRSVGSIKL